MKKLENEYRQLMQNETPNLWERISAGIDAKIAEEKEVSKETANETEETTGVVLNVEEEAPAKNKNQIVTFWKKYSLPLVACIAVILCVPLMFTGFLRMASGGSKSETEAADMAAPEEQEAFYSTTTEAADAPAEEYFEETVMEEAAAEEASAEAPEAVMEEADGTNNGISQDTVTDAMTESAEVEQNEAAAEEEEQELQDLKQDKEELTQILTVITFAAEENTLDEERTKGTLYYLTAEEAGECTVFVPSDLEANFVIDRNRKAKIIVRPGNKEYDFIFVEMAE